MLQAGEKCLFSDLVTKHEKDPAAFVVSIAVKFTGIVKIVADDRLRVEAWIVHPIARVVPHFVFDLIFREVVLDPPALHESCKALVEPDVAPVFASDEVAEPLMA